MATITWKGGTGDFNTGSLWSSGTVPASGDTAVVDASSGTASILLDGTDTVTGLTLNDAAAALTLTGALTLNLGTLDAKAGTLTVAGTLLGGTLIPDGATVSFSAINPVTNQIAAPELVDVAVDGTLDLSASPVTLEAIGLARPSLQAIKIGVHSELVILDDEAFDGQTIDLAGGVLADDDADPNTGRILIGPGTEILQDAASTTARIGPDVVSAGFGLGSVTNEGIIIANAGTLDLDAEGGAFTATVERQGPFLNVGTIEIGAGATVIDDTNGSLAGLGTILNSGGMLDLRGTLDNTNTTIDVAATGEFGNLKLDDTVTGGTIIENGGTLSLGSASLQGVTVKGTGVAFTQLTIGKNTEFDPTGAAFLLTALDNGYGQILLNDGAALSNARIAYEGTQYQVDLMVTGGATPSATLAATTTLDVGAGQILILDAGTNGTLVNDAVINVAAGGQLRFNNAATYAAGGTINVAPGAEVRLTGDIGLSALGNVVGSGARLVNTGTLDLHGSSVSTTGFGGFSSFDNTGVITDGTLVTVAGQNVALGEVDNGTLDTGSGVAPIQQFTVNNTTIRGAVQLNTDGVLDVYGNLNLENHAGTGPGTLILDQQPEIYVLGVATSVQFLQSMTLSNAIVLLSGITPNAETAAFNAQSDLEVQGYYTVTLAPSVLIEATTVNGPIGIMGGPGFFVSEGTIAVASGADLVLGPYGSTTGQNFVNQGLITIAAGGTLDVATQASIQSLGSIIGPGGVLRFDAPDSGTNSYVNTGHTLVVGGPTDAPNVVVAGAVITGGTIVNAGGQFTGVGFGELNGVTYVGPLHLTSAANLYGNTSAGSLRFIGGTLQSQSVTIDAGGELLLGADQSFTGATLALAGEFADANHILSFDPSTVTTIDGSVYMPAGHILNSGTIVIVAGGSLDMNDSGAISTPETSEAGTIVIEAGGTFASIELNSGQTVELGADGTLSISNRFDPGSSVIFEGPNTLKIEKGTTFDGTVSGFGVGDTLDLTGYLDGTAFGIDPTVTFGYDGTTLSVIRGGSTTIAAIPIGAGYDVAGFTVTESTLPPIVVTDYDITYAPPGQTPPSGPSISGTTAKQPTNDLTAVQPFSGVDLSDPNTGAVITALVTIPTSANGSLTSSGGGTLVNNGQSWIDTGGIAAVQAALRALGFTPTAHEVAPGQSVTTGFTIAVNDKFGVATDTTTSVVATAVEDPIQLSGVTPVVYSNNNINFAQPFRNITLSDPDAATFTATATLASLANASFGNSYNATIAANGVWSTSGNLATVTTALHDLIAYTTQPALPSGQSVSTTMTMAISDGVSQTATATSTIVIVADGTADAAGLNILGTTPGQMTTDQVAIDPFSSVALTDSKVGVMDTVTVTMSNTADGTFSDALGGTINAGTFTASATVDSTGIVSGIDTVLNALVFTPTRGQVPSGLTVKTDFTVTASNSFGSTSDAATSVIATSASGQLSISGAQPNQEIADNGDALPFAGVTISDSTPTPVDTATITLSNPASGTLTAKNGGTVGANGVFQVHGPLALVQAAVRAVEFTPVAASAGQVVTSGATINVNDGTLNATDTTTSLDVAGSGPQAAGGTPPSISGTVGNQGFASQTTDTPLATIAIADSNIGATETVTVTMSNSGDGTFSNLGGGSFNNGTYSVTGTPSAVTTALDALQFVPATPASGYVHTTTLTVTAVGPGGTVSDSTTSVTSVEQVLGLASVPAGQRSISVRPDGTGFAAATGGDTNEAVVSEPAAAGSYALPAGYQAAFLGEGADATLTDASVGNALLVGNTSNDTISAAASADTILSGLGTNAISVTGTNDLVLSRGLDDVVTMGGTSGRVSATGAGSSILGGSGGAFIRAAGADEVVTAGNGNTTIFGAGEGDSYVLGSKGTQEYVNLGGSGQITTGGGAATVFGSFGKSPGSDVVFGGSGALTLATGGSNDTINAGSGAATIFGAFGGTIGDNLINAGSGPLEVATGNSNDTVHGGTSAGDSVFSGFDPNPANNGNSVIFGGPDAMVIDTANSSDTIHAGSANDSIYLGSGTGAGNNLIFGGSGALRAQFVGGAGSATLVGGSGSATVYGNAGSDINFSGSQAGVTMLALGPVGAANGETLNAGGSSTGNLLAAVSGSDSVVGGSGDDTLVGGVTDNASVTGATTLTGGAGDNVFFFQLGAVDGTDIITDFTASAGNQFFMAGYDALAGGASGSAAAAALAGATTSNGNTTITLLDGTRITFDNATLAQLQGHVFSS